MTDREPGNPTPYPVEPSRPGPATVEIFGARIRIDGVDCALFLPQCPGWIRDRLVTRLRCDHFPTEADIAADDALAKPVSDPPLHAAMEALADQIEREEPDDSDMIGMAAGLREIAASYRELRALKEMAAEMAEPRPGGAASRG